jgi:hypothetical protein
MAGSFRVFQRPVKEEQAGRCSGCDGQGSKDGRACCPVHRTPVSPAAHGNRYLRGRPLAPSKSPGFAQKHFSCSGQVDNASGSAARPRESRYPSVRERCR